MRIPFDRNFVEGEWEEALCLIFSALPTFRRAAWERPENMHAVTDEHVDVVQGVVSFAGDGLSLPKGACWHDSPDMTDENLLCYAEEQWVETVQEEGKSLLMASRETLE